MAGTQEQDHRERRLLRRKNNTAVTVAYCKPAVKKARVCINCGNWIKKVETFYNGVPQGRQWIHFRARGMSERRFLYVIDRCIAAPRPVPQKEPSQL